MECMFRAEGGGATTRPRLMEHIRSRGHGSWVSASASPSGSYKTRDVLEFLKRHLPAQEEGPQQRPWRIMLADDAGAHSDDQVKKLCWSRGYVYIVHGGGVTPYVQTVDTHFNQHAKRKYQALEGKTLLSQMALGKAVPSLRPTDCIDLMVQVCSDMRLHLAAARGYVETGLKANLDDALLDTQITKEARYFWDELGMREKVATAVGEVREEARAGRLRWCYKHIMALVLPHPRKGKEDDVLARVGDYYGKDGPPGAGHCEPNADDEGAAEGEDAGSQAGSGQDTEHDPDEDSGGEADLGEWTAAPVPGGATGIPAAAAAAVCAPAIPDGVSAAEAKEARDCTELMQLYESMAGDLRRFGDIAAAAYMEGARDKERRRVRALCRENEGVLQALTQLEDAKRAAELTHRCQLQEANQRRSELQTLKRDVQQTRQRLRDEQRKVADAQATTHERYRLRRVSLAELGHGKRNCGGDKGKKARVEVTARLFKHGGLSGAQLGDLSWFCDEWDSCNLHEHGEEWPNTFMSWMQQLLDSYEQGTTNAFSQFMFSETRRCLSGQAALELPPLAEP